MEITSCLDYGSLNFEVVPRYMENVYTHGLFAYLFIYFIMFFIWVLNYYVKI